MGVRGQSPCQGRPLGGSRGVSPLRCRGSIRKICKSPPGGYEGEAPVKAARSAGREVSRRSDVAAQSEKGRSPGTLHTTGGWIVR